MSSQLNQNPETMQSPTLFDRIFRDRQGNIVIAQPPNLPLLVALTATIFTLILPSGKLQTGLDLLAFGVWFTWAWQEIFTGVNYFRRSLGLLVLVGLMVLKLSYT